MSLAVGDRTFYYHHEICRGPIIRLALHHLGHPRGPAHGNLLYQFTHASGDICSSGLSPYRVLQNLDDLVGEIRDLLRQGVGYACAPGLLDTYVELKHWYRIRRCEVTSLL